MNCPNLLSQLVTVEISPSDVSYTLSSLKPGSYNQVEVQAVNSIGMSSESIIFKTKESAPEQVVEEDEPEIQLSGQRSQSPTSPKLHVKERDKMEPPRKDDTILTGEPEIQLSGQRSQSPTSPKLHVKGRDKMEPPRKDDTILTGVPQQVHFTSHRDSPHSTSYKLTWDQPDDGGSRLIKYNIQYREVEIKPDGTEYELSKPLSQFVTVEISSSDISYTLSSLKPGSYYQVEVQAVNSIGMSSESCIFKTKENEPEIQLSGQHSPSPTSPKLHVKGRDKMEPPRKDDTILTGVPQQVHFTCHRDSPHSMSYKLTWVKPDDGGSRLIKYNIQYREVEINPNGTEYELSKPLSQLVTVDISPSDISYTLSSLKPGSYYQVEVQAVNSIGMSSESCIFKTKERKDEQEANRKSKTSTARLIAIWLHVLMFSPVAGASSVKCGIWEGAKLFNIDNDCAELSLYNETESLTAVWNMTTYTVAYMDPHYNGKIFMDEKRNIWIVGVERKDAGKYYLKCGIQGVQLETLLIIKGNLTEDEVQKWLDNNPGFMKKYFGNLTGEQIGQEVRKCLADHPEYIKEYLGSCVNWMIGLVIAIFIIVALAIFIAWKYKKCCSESKQSSKSHQDSKVVRSEGSGEANPMIPSVEDS